MKIDKDSVINEKEYHKTLRIPQQGENPDKKHYLQKCKGQEEISLAPGGERRKCNLRSPAQNRWKNVNRIQSEKVLKPI